VADLTVFQPLFPEDRVLGPLHDLAGELIRECHRLGGQAGQHLSGALAPRLRAMSSYYTNKIEGQHTRPADIERALRHEFDADAGLAKRQRLALAHIEVESELEQAVAAAPLTSLYSPEFICRLHARLYEKLPEHDRLTDEGLPIVPGEYRQRDVTAGRHLAPPWTQIADLLRGWAELYGSLPGMEKMVIGAACAHHRLAWVHPFIDGNGRTARLHTHLVLHALGLTHGLWSPMRGLARTQEQYYARLNNADLPRRNDYDGRGPLSQEELVAFARYLLEVCLDQVRFMSNMLELDALRERLRQLLRYLQDNPWQMGSEKSSVKIEALEALHYAAIAGPLERGRFIAMTGLGERAGRRVLASLIDFGVLAAETTRAPVTFAVPLQSLRFLFPRLWPEAEADSA
jgi:Fic family protein